MVWKTNNLFLSSHVVLFETTWANNVQHRRRIHDSLQCHDVLFRALMYFYCNPISQWSELWFFPFYPFSCSYDVLSCNSDSSYYLRPKFQHCFNNGNPVINNYTLYKIKRQRKPSFTPYSRLAFALIYNLH